MDLRDAYTLAEQLLGQHGLSQWRIQFDRAKRRAGVCRHRDRTIGLSAPLTELHSIEEVRETILHEIAHALAGPQHGHDEHWRRVALSIGSTGERCLDVDSPQVHAPWAGTCPAGHAASRHRRPERVVTCRRCSREFDLEYVLTWTKNGRSVPMHPNYVAELDRLRSGRGTVLLPVGARARITAAGEFQGLVGRIVKRGRTCYHLRAGRGVLRVPFAWVEPAGPR
jgi:predicted SprT family Zn-dependent metalloprotease